MNKKKKNRPTLRFPEFNGDWEERKLGDLITKNSLKNKELKYSLVQSVSNKYGFVNQTEYFEDRRVASKDTSNYYIIKKGYFAYNPSRINVGSLAYKFDDKISIISPLYVTFKANEKFILDNFLLNWFATEEFIIQMKNSTTGGVRDTLNYNSLIEMNIKIPSLQEQQKIAACLSSLDDLINAHQEKLTNLKDHKKGLLQNLFPKVGEKVPRLRFDGFEGDWEETTLGEVADIKKGQQLNKSELSTKGKYPCQNGGIDASGYTSNYNTNENTITISEGGNSCGYINFMTTKFWCGGHCYSLLNIKEEYNHLFLYQYLKANEYLIMQLRVGSGLPNIQKKDIQKLKIRFPKKTKEQQKIAACLSSLDDLISAQEQKIKQLQAHKKGLLQGLFPKS